MSELRQALSAIDRQTSAVDANNIGRRIYTFEQSLGRLKEDFGTFLPRIDAIDPMILQIGSCCRCHLF
jgi:hypothetical protein